MAISFQLNLLTEVKCFALLQNSLGQPVRVRYLSLKFGLSEKHTKLEKIFLMVLTNQLIYLVNVKTMTKIFSNYVCFSKSPTFNKIPFLKVFRENLKFLL